MTDELFEYKSKKETIKYGSNDLGISITKGLKCVWCCTDMNPTSNKEVLNFTWNFELDELKKKGIDRLSGYIILKTRLQFPSDNIFPIQKIDVVLDEHNQIINKCFESRDFIQYAMFEYHLTPHYTQIEEVNSSAEQNGTVPAIEDRKTNDSNKKVNSDEIVLTTEQNDEMPEKVDAEKVQDNKENLVSQLDKMFLPSKRNDAILVIDGKQVHVNKWFLSYHSKYFGDLFFPSNYNEGQMIEIPIDGISYNDFKLLLGPISSKPVLPNDESVEKLLELATRFKMSSVIHQCECHLLKHSKLENSKLMWIGEKYGMKKVFDKAMTKATDSKTQSIV